MNYISTLLFFAISAQVAAQSFPNLNFELGTDSIANHWEVAGNGKAYRLSEDSLLGYRVSSPDNYFMKIALDDTNTLEEVSLTTRAAFDNQMFTRMWMKTYFYCADTTRNVMAQVIFKGYNWDETTQSRVYLFNFNNFPLTSSTRSDGLPKKDIRLGLRGFFGYHSNLKPDSIEFQIIVRDLFPTEKETYLYVADIQFESYTASIPKLESNLGVMVYPNPASTSFSVHFDDHRAYTVELYSLSGQLLQKLHSVSDGGEIDLSGYDSGIYIVHILDSKLVRKTIKLVKY